MSSTTAPVQAGSEAPDFSLPSTSGETVTLSSFRGRQHVLLAFFPAAFSGICTTEFCAISDDVDAFSSADVQVLPISVDNVPSLQAFRDKHAMRLELLSDFKREVATAYGVLLPSYMVANRAYFLIDQAGVVRWAHVEEHPGYKRENSEILAAISALTA